VLNFVGIEVVVVSIVVAVVVVVHALVVLMLMFVWVLRGRRQLAVTIFKISEMGQCCFALIRMEQHNLSTFYFETLEANYIYLFHSSIIFASKAEYSWLSRTTK